MNTEALVGELLEDDNNKLVMVAKESGLAEQKQHALLSSFAEYFMPALAVVGRSQDIEVTSEDQKDDIEQASIARKELKKLRCDAENKRKSLKENALREGQTIDKMFGVIKDIIKPEEDRLEELEKIVERAAEKRRQEKIAERRTELQKRVDSPDLYKFESITDDEFASLLKQLDDEKKAKEEADKRARELEEATRAKEAEERLAREKAAEAEAERIRKENAKLKAEAEIREALLEKERAAERKRQAAQEKKLAVERAAADEERKKREALEAEKQAKIEADLKLRAEEAEAQRKALLAPDKDKLIKLADDIQSFEFPEVTNPGALAVLSETKDFLARISKNLRQKAEQL